MNELDRWHDFFFMVGGGAAALSGLVFVAMSMHLSEIVATPAHRHRSRTILTGLTAVFIRCALVLMGDQSLRAAAIEIIVVLFGVELILLRSVSDAIRRSGPAQPGVRFRAFGSFVCLVVEQAGALILFLGHSGGLYAVGVGMMASFVFMVSGAWLLLVGVDVPEQRLA